MTKRSVIPILFAIVLFSCKKSINTSSDAKSENTVYEFIKNLGYSDSEIKEVGDTYIVDGDIVFDKNSKSAISFTGPKTEQYGTSNYIGYNDQSNISVYVENISMGGYTSEVNAAIALWNNIPNCRLKFSFSTGLGIIRIRQANLSDPSACGQSYYPYNGGIAGGITMNASIFSGLSYDQRVSAIAHELGHSIGLRHTNWNANGGMEPQYDVVNGAYIAAHHILGTPKYDDANSIMNLGICGNAPTTLSSFDILAMQYLYPANPPVAGTVPVFRYYSRAKWQDHFYTPYYNELGYGSNDDYIFEGIAFWAFLNQEPGTVPVYRGYFGSTTGDHFYTTALSEIPQNNYEGVAFYAYTSPVNGAQPVYRYFSNQYGDHFYTKDQVELDYMYGFYALEGAGWYAY